VKTIAIVNPYAGNGRTEKIWPNIELALKQSIGTFQTEHTSCKGDATILTRKALEGGATRVIAIGGDGISTK